MVIFSKIILEFNIKIRSCCKLIRVIITPSYIARKICIDNQTLLVERRKLFVVFTLPVDKLDNLAPKTS